MSETSAREEQRRLWALYVRSVVGDLGPQAIARRMSEAHGTGPSQPSVGRWLRGEHLPKPAEAATFARTFEVSVLGAFVAAGYLSAAEATQGIDPTTLDLLRNATEST